MSSSLKSKMVHALNRFQERSPTLYFLADLAVNIAIVVALVYGVRTYLISPFQVSGPSMCNTLNFIKNRCQESSGEYLIVNEALYYPFFGKRYQLPQRGDIVVFNPPQNRKTHFIKRIIGLPGETVRIADGKVFIINKEHPKGWELPERYLNGDNKGKTYSYPSQETATYTVPESTYFVMGDNRRRSTDSRTCFRAQGDRECRIEKNHFLPLSFIEGKAWVVLWPLNKIRLLTNPAF